MADFGHKTLYVSSWGLYNRVAGSWFTCPTNGTGDSITAGLRAVIGSGTFTVKCALYVQSTYALVANGITEERDVSLTTTASWETFNFGTSPNLTANTVYVLVAWSEDACGLTFHGVSPDNQTARQDITYNGFPNPLVPDEEEVDECSVYCTYTPSETTDYKDQILKTLPKLMVYSDQLFDLTVSVPINYQNKLFFVSITYNEKKEKIIKTLPRFTSYDVILKGN